MIQDLKVLICDDSVLVRKKMRTVLSKLGITQIEEAVDGNEAVMKFSSFSPDITFMDIVMPNKSGVDALKDIHAINSTAKVVMASSIGTQGNLREAIENGAYDFIQKPVTDEMILRVISKVIQ